MGNLGATELIIIILIVLIFFGSKKIPELASGLGKGMREFRKATREVQEDQEESAPELKAPKNDTMTCIYCNSRVAKDSRFCPSCGKSLEAPRCPKCGRVNTLGAKFCVECGEKL
jgi:sec-independent protein translocase protein TatA